MKKKLFLMLTMIIVVASLIGCAGSTARSKLLLPTISEMWTSLKPDALAVVTDPNDLNAMDTAVTSGDGLTAAWTTTKPYVTNGIQQQVDEGTMSSTLAASKTETVTQMTEAIAQYDNSGDETDSNE